jgi:hypothetical protein
MRGKRGRWLLVVVVLVIAAAAVGRLTAPDDAPAVLGSAPAATTGSAGKSAVTAGRSPTTTTLPPIAVDKFFYGWTHEQYSPAESYLDSTARQRAEAVLREAAPIQNQHIFGWGAFNPEPSPGDYNWSSLDSRVELMARTGGIPVITLCCAPDWMKGGRPGQTDFNRLAEAPFAEHYDAFASLSAQVAARYPDVKYFLVWNELKGFYNSTSNRWDYEAYTTLYNKVYDAVKKVRPDANIGGPYVVLDSWGVAPIEAASDLRGPWGTADQRALDVVNYWLKNKHGAQFIAVDGYIGARDNRAVEDPSGKFAALTAWLRDRTDLPIWWAELHPTPATVTTDDGRATSVIDALDGVARAGGNVVLLWDPNNFLYSDLRNRGGEALATARALEAWTPPR